MRPFEIGVPYEEILARQERVQAARRFENSERVRIVTDKLIAYLDFCWRY